MHQELVIIGGGIAGLSIALGLQNKGIQSHIYEAAAELKPVGAGIGLSFNAVKACEKLGIRDAIKQAGNYLEKAWITDSNGNLLSAINYNKHLRLFQEISVVLHRYELHQILLSKLNTPQIHLNKRVKDFQTEAGHTRIDFEDGTSVTAKYVIAADGIHSIFRKKLIAGSYPRYSGYTCWRGSSTLPETYPYREAVIESWGKGRRLGVVPLKDNKVYWFAVINAVENDSTMKNLTKEKLLNLFQGFHSHYLDVLKGTPENQIIWNDISDIEPLKQFAFGNIVLTGDAAHATTPDLGQGGCQALEDAVVLSQCMASSTEYAASFQNFEEIRIERTTKVIETSRRLASIGQLENGLLTWARNLAMKLTPESMAVQQIKWLTETSF